MHVCWLSGLTWVACRLHSIPKRTLKASSNLGHTYWICCYSNLDLFLCQVSDQPVYRASWHLHTVRVHKIMHYWMKWQLLELLCSPSGWSEASLVRNLLKLSQLRSGCGRMTLKIFSRPTDSDLFIWMPEQQHNYYHRILVAMALASYQAAVFQNQSQT